MGEDFAVPRPELLSRMDAAGAIVLVVAAAGYGKTRLLREWESHDARPFLWLSATEAVARATAPHGAPVVVVIDDLDREASATPDFSQAVRALTSRPATTVVLAGARA